MYAFAGADSARSPLSPSFHRRKLLSFASAAAIAIALPTVPALAQEAGKYFMADGSKTDDLEKAAASWRDDPEFKGLENAKLHGSTMRATIKAWGSGAMHAEYAYALGYTGAGVKVGILDSGVDASHPELNHSGIHTVAVTGQYSSDGPRGPNNKEIKKGDIFNVSGGYIPSVNDGHGTSVASVIAAARNGMVNGFGMQGVAFGAEIYSANTDGKDDDREQGSDNLDYGYFSAAYDALAKANVRIVNESWGTNSPHPWENRTNSVGELTTVYSGFLRYRMDGNKTWLDAAAEAGAQHDYVHVISTANDTSMSNPDILASLPYFHPEIEKHIVAVSGLLDNNSQYFNKCGVAKYWCVMGPSSKVPAAIPGSDYERFSGTSAAAPFVSAALALVMQRYPYMTNEQARDVLLTTAQSMTPSSQPSSATSAVPLKSDDAKVPNATTGWGLPDLKKAMNGPAQFLSRLNVNLGAGVADTWANNISQEAIDQRRQEEQKEVEDWEAKKKANGWTSAGLSDAELQKTVETQRGEVTALLTSVADAISKRNINGAMASLEQNRLAAVVFNRFLAATTYWDALSHAAGDLNLAKTIAGELTAFLKTSIILDADIERAKAQLKFEFPATETRTAYLATKTYEAGLTKSGLGTLTLSGKNTWRGDTIVDGGELAIAREGSIISSAIINDTGLFTVDGSAADVNVNKGGALHVGESGKTLGLLVDGGTASIDGFSDMASVLAGGVLSGTGKLGNLDMREGGHVAPGHSIGTLTVTGDATFAKGSFYDVEIAPDLDKAGELKSDLLSVDGKAQLLGGIVSVSLENEKTLMSKEQVENLFLRKGVILTATKGVSGQFERVLPEYSYIIGLLDYSDAGKVSLGFDLTDAEKAKIADKLKADLLAAQDGAKRLQAERLAAEKLAAGKAADDLLAAQNEAKRLQAERLAAEKLAADKAAADLLAAQDGAKRLQIEMLKQAVAGLTIENADKATHNQKAVFDAVKALGYGNALTNTIFLKERGEVLPYDNLSGEAHATLSGVLAKDASVIGNAAQNRIRAAFDGVTVKEQAVIASPLAYAPAQPAKTSDAFASVAPAPATTALWGEAYGGWAHAGGDGNAAGYSRNTGGFVTGLDGVVADDWRMGVLAGYGNISLDSRASNASVDSYSVGLYGGTAWDNLRLSLGTALTQSEIGADRMAVFGNLVNRHSASYDAKTVQVFGELGYSVRSAYADLEPFAAVSHVHLKSDGFQESGAISNLTGLGGTSDLTTTALGLRASREFSLSDTVSLTARGLLGWSHAFGDVTPVAKLAFAGGQPFSVEGLPVAPDTGVVEAGLDVGIGKATTLGLTYSGQFSGSASDNAVKADLTVRF
ncbi:autotransporter domain-containing protein [Candidatus Phyllobacterium onerii]|uniref:autotransporter domain-containing protein n=1 Tax=Candidatus Phyllobacterium onerii TaxID=3020828 RepID=UPI00232AD2FC|nr:autotransporter domain-containing protein [Phyllobacterium sp. IY22]